MKYQVLKTLPQQHFEETKRRLKTIDKKDIAKWLLEEGYYPEEYVVPPCFKVKNFDLQTNPFYQVNQTEHGGRTIDKFEPSATELLTISFPKTQFADRVFGIINPKIYHDIVWYMIQEWELIVEHLFTEDIKIFSYSFPLPVGEGVLGELRGGRMIYEFIEMAEDDLVSESYKYKYLLKTDIKNFYPSIYTHSIAWALHTKQEIRTNIDKFNSFLGLKLDKLFQYANDRCTNGIPIGSAVSDLIAEIILASIDKNISKKLDKKIDFLGVRFKDDYMFLCQTKEDASKILKILQKEMKEFNLNLNESKSQILNLPEGLFRDWKIHYKNISLKKKEEITYEDFLNTFLQCLDIDKKYPETGIIDKFLNELIDKDYNLKLRLYLKDIPKIISLLFSLKEKRPKSFPQILGILEIIIQKLKLKNDTNLSNDILELIAHVNKFFYQTKPIEEQKKEVLNQIEIIIKEMFDSMWEDETENEYNLLWMSYFIKSNNLFDIDFKNYTKKIKSNLISSIKLNNCDFYKPLPNGIKIYTSIKGNSKNNIKLVTYLDIFSKDKNDTSFLI